MDDGDKGRVVLAEDVRLLEHALAGGGRPRNGTTEPTACRVRLPDPAPAVLAERRRACEAHPGPVPLFVHLLVGDTEVVVRARGLGVEPGPDLAARLAALAGGAAVTVDHAGRP